MKTKKDIEASSKAALKRLVKNAKTVATLGEQQLAEFSFDRMGPLRGYAEDLLQRVHEYNAYSNVLHTGDKLKKEAEK